MTEEKTKIETKQKSEFWHMIWMIQNKSIVLDPDGWDRNNWEKSWGEEITWEEFNQRVMKSTICPVDFDHIVRTLEIYPEIIKGV